MNFIMKKMLQSKLKSLPKEQQELIMKLIDENPGLFKKIGEEIKAKKKAGLDEQTATMQIMFKYQNELQKLMQK